MKFEDIGLLVPNILLPKEGIDLTKWSVVACDQFTSEEEYWKSVKELVGNSPSTLNIIFPEVYLDKGNDDTIIKSINSKMTEYLNENIFDEHKGFILVDRKTSHADSRKGLVVALDLDRYDYNKGSQTLIRATEGTIVERLPPRIKIRENAMIELPHIMVLIDDPDKTVIEPLFEKGLNTIYDFDLMKNSGHIKGYLVNDESLLNEISKALRKLADQETFNEKYGVSDKGVLLYAMGDGNHSLATAKAIWTRLKENGADDTNPGRYALVELVNVHDTGLEFEPIHRVLFNVDKDNLLNAMTEYYSKEGFSFKEFKDESDWENELKNTDSQKIGFVTKDGFGMIYVKNPKLNLAVGTLQNFLDVYLKNSTAKIDYVHGFDVVTELGSKPSNMGFYLPKMSKHDLFKTVILDGALPRKTFSMGEADEKRFYLECRKIK